MLKKCLLIYLNYFIIFSSKIESCIILHLMVLVKIHFESQFYWNILIQNNYGNRMEMTECIIYKCMCRCVSFLNILEQNTKDQSNRNIEISDILLNCIKFIRDFCYWNSC